MTLLTTPFQKKARSILMLGVLTVFVLMAGDVLAASGGGKEMDWGKMAMTLFGGLAIFLYGMEMMSEALRQVAGEKMKDILAKMTTNPVAGVLTGATVTAVIQSSSVTTVLVVGFVTAGLMNLSQALGVIFGANIGTTITAQIVAFKVTKFALLMVSVGFLMNVIPKEERIRQWGAMLMGLGLVFFGMKIMGDAMKPLRSYQPFLDLMTSMESPILGILVATAFTGLVQSSSATTSIVIVMASQGLITLPAGIALAFGANIGTCATALLACIGKPRVAVQAAVAHLLFNVGGVLLWVGFIDQLIQIVTLMSPAADGTLVGQAKLAAEAPRQIANAHTVFNVVNTLVFLPLVKPFGKLVLKLVPDRPQTVEEEARARFKPQYLDDNMMQTPALALSMARREAVRMADVVEKMLVETPAGAFKGNVDHMLKVREQDDQVDILYGEIAKYLARVSRENLTEKNAEEAMTVMTTITELENIGDIVEIHFHHLAEIASANHIELNESTLRVLNDYHAKVVKAFKSAMAAFEQDRMEAAKLVLNMEQEIVDGVDRLTEELHAEILRSDGEAAAQAGLKLESDLLENMKRVYLHTKRIAKMAAHQEGANALVAI